MKLYTSQINSYLRQSENLVLHCHPLEDGVFGVILDDSCLYAEGGGQPWDLGSIDNHEVLRVEIVPEGLQVAVKHSFPIGSTVTCRVDWERRYDFMQQHSCQHLLRSVSGHPSHSPI
jgi:alanyl-tRNA synthetase